jgi:HEAT repeat protein
MGLIGGILAGWAAVAAGSWATSVRQDLVGYWRGDEADPPPDGVAADVTGAHPGTYRNGATTVGPLPGTPPTFKFPNDRCMTFPGGNAQVVVPDAPALRLIGDFTVSFWVRATAAPSDWVRFVGKGNLQLRQFGVWLEPGTRRILFQQYNGAGESIVNLLSSAPIGLDAWHHVACAVRGQTALVYVNGSLGASAARSGTPAVSADPLTFGYGGMHGGFQGQLDDIRLYGRALEGEEIAVLAQGGAAVDEAAVAQMRARKVEAAMERFRKLLRDPAPSVRAAAVSELAGVQDEKTLKMLAEILMGGDPSPGVRAAAARALGKFGRFRPSAAAILRGAMGGPNQKEPEVQAAVLEGWSALGDEEALPTIHHHFRADPIRVAKAAVAAAGAMRRRESIEPLIDLGEDVEKWLKREQAGPYRDDRGVGDRAAAAARLNEMRAEIFRALQSITREKWTTFQEWRIWWSRRKASYKVPD